MSPRAHRETADERLRCEQDEIAQLSADEDLGRTSPFILMLETLNARPEPHHAEEEAEEERRAEGGRGLQIALASHRAGPAISLGL